MFNLFTYSLYKYDTITISLSPTILFIHFSEHTNAITITNSTAFRKGNIVNDIELCIWTLLLYQFDPI